MLALALAVLLAATAARAESPPLRLDGPARAEALAGHVDALLEAEDRLTPEDLVGPGAVEMMTLPGAVPDFGYTPDRVWLRFGLVNETEHTEWRLHFRENFKQEFSVFALRSDGTTDTLFDIGRDSPFSARPIPYPEMVAPLHLEPGEAVTVIVRFRSEGASYLSFAVETLESFSEIANTRIAKGYAFYGMMLLLIGVSLISLVLFQRAIFAAYAAYASAALLYIMHGDGVTFQVLWPNWPGFNSMASVVAGTGIIVFGAIFARVFLETKRLHPILDGLLLGVIGGTLALDAALWWTNPQLLKKTLILVSMFAMVLFLVTGLVAARTRFREVRFYIVAWLGVVASAGILNARHVLGLDISQDAQFDSMRAALVFDATMIGLAIADRYNILRRSRRAALDASLRQARENARLAARLAQLGGRYDRALALARGRGELIENTAHDLRQPMQALRLTLARLGENAGPAETERFEASLAYMERLIEDRIADGETLDAPAEAAPAPDEAAQRMSAHSVLQSVQAMFAPEAEAKALDLRLRLSAPDRPVSAFALMRIASNLVSNAIRYTGEGGVLIALRREGSGLRLEVHDTGPGLDAEAFAQARARHVQLDRPGQGEGSGLGLAIACAIAAEAGWTLAAAPCARGSRMILHLPAEAEAEPGRRSA